MRLVTLFGLILGSVMVVPTLALSSTSIRELGTVGTIRDSVAHEDGDLIVATDEGIVARLSAGSSDVVWRTIISSADSVHKVVLAQDQAFLLSTDGSSSSPALGMVRAFETHGGDLLWELPLPMLNQSNLVGVSDLLYSSELRCLRVLHRGEVHVIYGLNASPTSWSVSNGEAYYTQLLPLSGSSLQAVAAGCSVGTDGRCGGLVVLEVDVKTRGVHVRDVSAVGQEASLHLVGSTSDRVAFAWSVAQDQSSSSLQITFTAASKGGASQQASVQLPVFGEWTTRALLPGAQPALLICFRASGRHCLAVTAQSTADGWALVSEQTDGDAIRLPVFVRSPQGGLEAIRFVTLGTGASPSALHLAAPVEIHSALSSSQYLQLHDDKLLLVDGSGLTMLLVPLTVQHYALPASVLWARDEGLSKVQWASLLSTSPALEAESASVSPFVPAAMELRNWKSWLNDFLSNSRNNAHRHHGMAVFVSHSSLEHGAVSWSTLQLRVRGVGLSAADGDWLAVPAMPSACQGAGDVMVRQVSAMAMHWQPHSEASLEDANSNAVLVAVDTATHGTIVWILDASEGHAFPSLAYDKSTCQHFAEAKHAVIGGLKYSAALPTASLQNEGALLHVSAGARLATGEPDFHIIYRHGEDSLQEVRPKRDNVSPVQGDRFLHSLDPHSGVLSVFKLTDQSCPLLQGAAAFACHTAHRISHARLGAEGEGEVVAVAYANPSDPVDSLVSVLGDDNMLRKYLNPHLLAACVAHSSGSMMIYAIDAASGRIVRRWTLDSAAGPAQALVMENYIVVSYYNAKAKRAELFVAAVYEGFIGKTELTPGWESLPRLLGIREGAADSEVRSAFAQPQLLSVEKTYILPRTVLHLQHTASAKGISHKNLLLSLDSGEAYSIDLRMVHPRRPLSEPTPAEKEEGLARYNPFIIFNPIQSLTGNSSLEGSGALQAISAPSARESTCTVLLYGLGGSRGVRLLTHTPSQGFDTLAEDFNYALLLLLLTGLAACVALLRVMHVKNTLRRLWL